MKLALDSVKVVYGFWCENQFKLGLVWHQPEL
jgi:hypothetical protein